MVKAAHDLALEALRSVVGVALTVEVLRVDAGDEAGVAWDALVADVMHRSVHPGDASLAHVTAHGRLLGLLVLAIDRGGAHLRSNIRLLHDRRAGVNHPGLVGVAEVLASLPVRLTSGLPNDVLLEGDEARVTGDFQAALHFAIFFKRNKITIV